MAELTAVPQGLAPMLAVHADVPPGPGWSYEVKWDGHRALARVVGGVVGLRSRAGHDTTAAVPGIQGLGDAPDCLLDGELVVLDRDGRPDFGLLQRRLGDPHGRGPAVTYLVFDVLHLHGRSCLDLPHAERRALLSALGLDGEVWSTPSPLTGSGPEVLAAVRGAGLEGVIAKESAGPYRPGVRSSAWRKLVNLRTADVVVGGWQPGAGRRAGGVGSVLVGVPAPDGLRYAGHVGTGFTDAALDALAARLAPLARRTSPFVGPVPAGRARTARWVDPVVAGEVAFAAWTTDGLLRQARWREVRGG